MALLNPNTGEYLKVTEIWIDVMMNVFRIRYLLFANREQRERVWSLTPYEKYEEKIAQYEIPEVEVNGLLKDVLIERAYILLKNDMYVEWVDV